MLIENIKYVIVEDDEFSAEEIADIHGADYDKCVVIDKEIVEDHKFGNLILLTSQNFGINLKKIRRDVRFCFIPCWYYPESRILVGKTRTSSLLLNIARTIANFITISIMKLTGKEFNFEAKVIK